MKDMHALSEFSIDDMKNFEPTMKIGMLATINPEGLPHMTLISSLQAANPAQLVWGQFTEGVSKQYIRQNPRTGFLIMNMEKEVWRGKADFTHSAKSGTDYDRYNNTPMFRYNAYFGIHTVYYMHLLEHSGKSQLPMPKIVAASIKTMVLKPFTRKADPKDIINAFGARLISKIGNIKFLSYVDKDGYPLIIPVFQAATNSNEEVLFSTAAYQDDLGRIPEGAPVALFGMTLAMEDVLLRGHYSGQKSFFGMKYGKVTVDWVYNAMPPNPQQIYPPLPVKPVTDF